MENYIIIGILIVIIAVALLRVRKHFGGGCCSSGNQIIRITKTLTEPVIGEKTMIIDGMHCENCEIRVENALNRIDGVACKVRWKKKTAVVSYSSEVSDLLLKQTVERLGYRVAEIR